MTVEELIAIIRAAGATGLSELTVQKQGMTLSLRSGAGTVFPPGGSARPVRAEAAAAPLRPAAETVPAVETVPVKTPMAGIVHLTASPGEPALVSAGARVAAGATVCIIEAMKLFTPIIASQDGIVEDILVDAGQEVGSGQTLMHIRTGAVR